MGSDRARRSAEIVGLMGVIGSLVFVGLEIRQNSRATRASTDAEVASQFLELNMAMAQSPELADAFAAAYEAGHPSLASSRDQTLMLGLYRGLFHIWSNVHRQHLTGTVNPQLYEAVLSEIAEYTRPVSPDASERHNRGRMFAGWAWESERFIYNPEFVAFMDSLFAKGR